jgi:hypothetical protein
MRAQLFTALVASASLALAISPAHAAPPIAYGLVNGTKMDLYLTNPNASGKVLLYSTDKKVNIGMVDMDPSANRLALVQSDFSGFKVIDYSSAGVRTNVTSVSDACQIHGIDFHPTDGSLLLSESCTGQGIVQVRRWTQSGFDSAPLATFGSPQLNGVGHVRWLGDGSGFLVGYLHDNGDGSLTRRIDRYMLNALSSPVTVIELATNPLYDFDTARCTGSFTGPCWALVYDDGNGKIHKLHFDSMSTIEDWVKPGATPHFSPDNSQTLYRLQVKTNMLLKVDDFSVVSKGDVGAIDWRP